MVNFFLCKVLSYKKKNSSCVFDALLSLFGSILFSVIVANRRFRVFFFMMIHRPSMVGREFACGLHGNNKVCMCELVCATSGGMYLCWCICVCAVGVDVVMEGSIYCQFSMFSPTLSFWNNDLPLPARLISSCIWLIFFDLLVICFFLSQSKV